ncbi:MAG: hypothetical protein GMKNLPBB_03159 [Myxococcota bacterium]|nr:hypothetical protein [Myxococcota bacterium]
MRLVSALLFLSAAALSACGSENDPVPGGPDLQLIWTKTSSLQDDCEEAVAGAQGVPADVAGIDVEIFNPDGKKKSAKSIPVEAGKASHEVAEVEPGENYTIAVRAYDRDQTYIWSGVTTGVKIEAGKRASAPVYMSRLNGVTCTGTAMTARRAFHTATVLKDGRVLIVGGFAEKSRGFTYDKDGQLAATKLVEIYDPRSGAFRQIEASLNTPRAMHTATLLDDGKVLIAGGVSQGFFRPKDPVSPYRAGENTLKTFEIFDPEAENFVNITTTAKIGNINFNRALHQAVKLKNGNVVLVGGDGNTRVGAATSPSGDTIEFFNAARNRFEDAKSLPKLKTLHAGHVAMVLADGATIVVFGGARDSAFFAEQIKTGRDGLTATIDKLDIPEASRPSISGAKLTDAQMNAIHAAAVRLADGRLAIFGGFRSEGELKAPQGGFNFLLDAAKKSASAITPTDDPRALHQAVLLNDGSVFVGGGVTNTSFANLKSISIYSTEKNRMERQKPQFSRFRSGFGMVLLQDGNVLITGGMSDKGEILARSELYNAGWVDKLIENGGAPPAAEGE